MKNKFIITIFLTWLMLMGLNVPAQKYSRLSDLSEDIKNSKPFKRIEWNHRQRAYPYDTIPYIYAKHVAAREIEKIRQKSNQSTNFLDWVPKGPSFVDVNGLWPYWDKVSGRVKAMAVHPTDHLTVYIGAASGGIWKTSDGGNSWMDIGRGLDCQTYGAIAISSLDPEVIYAGTGEAIAVHCDWLAWGGDGLYKSSDGGASWDTIDAFGEHTVFTDIVVSQFDSDILFASLASGSINMGGSLSNEGVWKSTDTGNSWIKTLDLEDAYDIALHPYNQDIVYACIGGLQTTSGIYISTDQGETWSLSSTGLPAPEIIGRLQMDISQSDPNIIYTTIYLSADTVASGKNTVAYKSQDSGFTWSRIGSNDILGGFSGSYWYDQGWYDLCIAVDPQNSDHVFIGNVELHETTDGQNFSPVRYPGGTNLNKSIAHVDYHQLKYALSNPDYFYIGCDGGVYLSNDDCNSAMSRNVGLETIQFYRMGSHPSDPNIMIAGSQDNGTIRTTDDGDTWNLVMGGDGMECFFDNQNPIIAYASYQQGVLMRSTNGGSNWANFGVMNGAWVTPYFAHTQNSDILYSANYDILKGSWSTNWQVLTTNLSPVLINTMAQSRINPNHMILAGNISETTPYPPPPVFPVMVSNDGGYNWTDVTENIPGEIRWISRVLCDPLNENTMYIVRCGFSVGNKIYRTTDLGQTWANISGDLPDIPCNTMFIDPDNTQHIYVGTDLGVYLSEDGGELFEYAGGDMPLVPIMDFEYVKIDNTGYLRVATHGRSIYETIFYGVDIAEKSIHKVSVLKIYPNPCEGATRLRYQISDKTCPDEGGGFVISDLYSISGLRIRRLLNEEKAAGEYEVAVDMSALPAGVYFCTLQTEDGVETVKLVKY